MPPNAKAGFYWPKDDELSGISGGGGVKWFEVRERFTGFTWPHLTALCLVSGAIGGVVASWWQLDKDWFPVLALVIGATVILVNVALVKLAGRIFGRYDD